MKGALEARRSGGMKKGTGSERRVAKQSRRRSAELQTNQKIRKETTGKNKTKKYNWSSQKQKQIQGKPKANTRKQIQTNKSKNKDTIWPKTAEEGGNGSLMRQGRVKDLQ